MIGAGALGFPGALAASAALNASWLAAAARDRPPDRALALSTGIAIGVPLLHFTLWPWAIGRRVPVPVLVEAEGLPATLLPVYNALLYAWAGAGVGALVVETPPRHRRLGVVALAIVLASRPLVRRHFEWMSDEARRRPRWWNRAWLRSPRWSST